MMQSTSTSPTRRSASPSPSPPHSPSPPSPHSPTHPAASSLSLSQLLNHLLSSKQSLSSTAYVHRAHAIIESARACLATSLTLSSRTSFLETGLRHHIHLLSRLHSSVVQTSTSIASDFSALLEDLDAVDARLRQTLSLLQSTTVNAAFLSLASSKSTAQKTLHDYLSPSTLSTLQSTLHAHIDTVQTLQSTLTSITLTPLAADIQTLTSSLSGSSSSSLAPTQAIAALLPQLDAHASELATSLSSLVRHYDLCVTALRHAEGATSTNLPPVSPSTSHHAALTEPEYRSVVSVLAHDALELDDVVLEMQSLASEMEAVLSEIDEHVLTLEAGHAQAVEAFRALDAMSGEGRVRAYVARGKEARERWEEERDGMRGCMEEMDALGGFYEGFLAAYDGMVLEGWRRGEVEREVRGVLREARKRVQGLRDDDLEERERFKAEHGEYLPADIWPGLVEAGRRWRWVAVQDDGRDEAGGGASEDEGEVAGGGVPALSDTVVEEARKRVAARMRKVVEPAEGG